MDRRFARPIVQLAALTGFAMSAWLLVQYLLPPSLSVCGVHGGCNAVRACSLAQIGGGAMPFWPVTGVAAFGALLGVSLSSSDFARRALPWMAGLGAATGLFLFVAQRAVCHAFCPFCIVSDMSGIVAGAAAFWGRDETVRVSIIPRVAFSLVGLVAFGGSFYWGMRHSDHIQGERVELPPTIAHEQRPGVATIVEFADYECPYCRNQHTELSRVLPTYGGRVHFVRKNLPLRMHAHAEDAARAACCADEQGQREAMADALFHAEDLTPEGCEQIASHLGLNMSAYRECIHAPRTQAKLDADRQAADEADVRGLPTMFVGNERFDGVVPAATLRQSIDRALHESQTVHASM